MIPTVLSSFCFVFPIYLSYVYQDVLALFLFSFGMGLSIANHSHTFHPDQFRRELFQTMDVMYMELLTLYLVVDASYRVSYLSIAALIWLNSSIFRRLGKFPIEQYTQEQRILHVWFHVVGISSFCYLRFFRV
jgi:hypothetical protein